jgi:phosphoribosyl 1,2-cyclic phosphodiesterase
MREYSDGQPLEIKPGFVARPLRVSHDAEPTFAFRVDSADSQGLVWSIGYASDLGCGSAELIEKFAGVNVLALEFNHDVRLERRSRRPKFLIDRVLSDWGHLSNDQAGELAAAIIERSGDQVPEHLVQLHLSRECNRPDLAAKAGQVALGNLGVRTQLTTARQDAAARSIPLLRRTEHPESGLSPRAIEHIPSRLSSTHPVLPGFE